MKSQKSSNSIRTLAVSVIVCIALILSTVCSFGLFSPKGALAEDEEIAENGIRFVQVAAGEDFAIGLTYDGDLYGWSLLGEGEHPETDTLGGYYSSVPTKINVVFRAGPGSNGARFWTNGDYHSTYESQNNGNKDRILQIAATRYTAAFITEAGYIYTWGSDSVNRDYEYSSEGGYVHNLLLRPCNASASADEVWYKPYIINYDYYGDSSGVRHPLFSVIPNGFGSMSIAGGEYNYIFVYSTSNNYYSFVWGSLQYAVTNRSADGTYSTPDSVGSIATDRYIYRTSYTSTNVSSVTAVAGGYTVGMNGIYSANASLQANTTSLTLRGRNFISTQPLKETDDNELTPVATVATTTFTYSIQGSDEAVESNGYSEMEYRQDAGTYTIANSIIGGYKGQQEQNSPYMKPVDTGTGNGALSATGRNEDLYYGRQAFAQSGTGSMVYTGNSDAYKSLDIYNSDGTVINSGDSDAKIIHYDVSLGNDIGYGLRNGTLYAWGDNGAGQLTSSVTNEYSQYPTQILAGVSDIISVAAGKQISSDSKPFVASSTFSGTEFLDEVKNDETFISGAVAGNGSLYVWSNNNPAPQAIVFGGTNINGGNTVKNNYNKFAAVYSGYKNNIFAITRLGKLVRITYDDSTGDYVQTIYDKFADENGEIINWTVGASTNTVNFAVRANEWVDEKTPPELGEFILYIDNGYVTKSSISVNGISDSNVDEKAYSYSGIRGSMVNSNNIGDVYRILDYNNDSGIKYLNTTGTEDGNRSLSADALKPVFKFNGVQMEDKQRENMFGFSFVYSNEYGIGIKIEPYQSSKDGTVTVEFYVARYDCAQNFVISNNSFPTDNAIYYDYQKCSLNFTIENTPAYKVFDRYDENGNSNIPLLDPNNAYNNQYSIAVQDVNSGYVELVKYLQNDQLNANFANDILAEMKKKDVGFPDVEKVTLGNLEYSLGESAASKAYSGSYKYLLNDRDADLSLINNVTAEFTGGAQTGSVTASYVKIDISVDVSSYGLKSGEAYYSRRQLLAQNFNNTYGLYDITFTDGDDGKTTMSFSYLVVLFTAVNGTGTIKYNSDSVTAYSTSENDSKYANINVTTREYTTYTNDFVVNTANGKYTAGNWNSAVAVFAQPTVRLKDVYRNGDSYIYGDPESGNNTYTIDYTATHTVTVGTTYTINLSDYITQTGVTGSQISFSYDNAANFADFNKQFSDETGYYAEGEIVKVSASSITVRPTTTHALNFTVAIQRFYGNGTQYFADDNEKVYLTFKFTTITGFDLVLANNANFSPRIEQQTEIDVLNYITVPERYNDLIRLSSLQSLDNNVLSITTVVPENVGYITGTKFTVAPKSSGTSVVQFVVTVYDKSIIVTLTFYVSGITNIDDPIDIVDVQYVYLNSLLNSLKQANSFNATVANYTALTRDVDANGNSKAVYFTDLNGEVQPNLPPFVKSVYFVDIDSANPRLRIEANTDETDLDGSYKLCVRFVNELSGYSTYEQAEEAKATILSTSQVIRSSRRVVKDNGVIYTIYIDCDESRAVNSVNRFGDWYTDGINTDMKVYIPVQLLLSKVDGIGSPEAYDIFLVSASTDAATYFNYSYTTDKKFVVITPLYNTPVDDDGMQNPITVSVSTASTSNSDSLILSFRVAVTGISTTLAKSTYITIWLVAFFGSLGLLLIIFIIRMIIYWRRRAKQRAIIKRNQELIKMRDRIHNKATAATREQALKTKLKMNDPKYAKMFNEMKKDRQDDSGITLENADLVSAPQMSTGVAAKSKKKKKGGKKTIAELRAELEAKKAAFAQAQSGDAINPINPFADPMAGGQDFGESQGFDTPVETFEPQAIVDDGNEIIFDVPDDGSQG